MADDPDPEKVQASREFVHLQHVLGIRTPRKLQEMAQQSRRIRAFPRSKVKKGGGR